MLNWDDYNEDSPMEMPLVDGVPEAVLATATEARMDPIQNAEVAVTAEIRIPEVPAAAHGPPHERLL